MEQAFPALSQTLNSSMALQGLYLSAKDLRRLELADVQSLTFLEDVAKCQGAGTKAANTKCVLEAISKTERCRSEYQGLVRCAKRLAGSTPETIKSNVQACRKPERELSHCVDGLVSDLMETLSGQFSDIFVFERLEHIDD